MSWCEWDICDIKCTVKQWNLNNSRIYSSSYLNYWIYISMSSKNTIRRINFEQRTSWYYKAEL